MRFILSTVGTSILTNSINKKEPNNESEWGKILVDSANLKEDELENEAQQVIEELAERAREKLNQNDVHTNRMASAELNGIYGIYEGRFPKNSNDQHYLICTDTAQGKITGELVYEFLEGKGFNVSIETPTGLSTKDTSAFTDGIKELIKWLEDNVTWRRDSGYRVTFNLVGGFKSLQGYMQTFGTFYADETVYIFERSSDLIRIPRLPIKIDTSVIEGNLVKFAMMAADEMYPIKELNDIPETLLEKAEDHAGISAWGLLVWNQSKSDLLKNELLQFPRLEYTNSFRNDYNDTNDPNARVKLQETLASVSFRLQQNKGSTEGLEGGFKFKPLQGFNNTYTFRIARGIRVSCSKENGILKLHKYGHRNVVNNNPISDN